MPGPPRWRTPLLIHHCLTARKILVPTIDATVTDLLTFVQKLAQQNPEVVYGDGHEGTRDSVEGRDFCRKLASETMVLLKNDDELLPLRPQAGQKMKVAVIGPNAQAKVISGGGSAALKPSYVVTPYEGIVANAPEGVEIHYSVGCYGN